MQRLLSLALLSPLLPHSPAHLPSSKTVLLPPTRLHLLPIRDPRRLHRHRHYHPPPLSLILDIQSSDFSDLSIVCDTIHYTQYQHRVCPHPSSTASTWASSWLNPLSSLISSHHCFCLYRIYFQSLLLHPFLLNMSVTSSTDFSVNTKSSA